MVLVQPYCDACAVPRSLYHVTAFSRSRTSTMAAFEQRKGGYDCEFVSSPPKSLECPVCLLTLRDPHVISCCGNEFCQVCIERVQRDGKPCPLCNELKFTTFLHKKLVREVNALVVRCPQKEQGCEWEGELGQLQGHLNPGAGVSPSEGCAYVLVSCTYQCGAHLQRKLLREHMIEKCPKRPAEISVTSMMQKMEDITAENKLLRQELCVIQDAHKKEIKEMKFTHENDLCKVKEAFQEELGKLKQLQQQEMSKLRSLVDKMKQNHQKMHQSLQADINEQSKVQKRKLVALEEECASLCTHTTPLPLPPFYVLMKNVDYYLENGYHYTSDPFYSHPGGYKMNIVAYPNSSSTHLSVGITILRGEFDDQLKWPFNGEVIIQAYNRTEERWSTELSVVLNRRVSQLDVVRKRVDSLSYACYAMIFLSHSELESDYAQDINIIRFRVTNVRIFN